MVVVTTYVFVVVSVVAFVVTFVMTFVVALVGFGGGGAVVKGTGGVDLTVYVVTLVRVNVDVFVTGTVTVE